MDDRIAVLLQEIRDGQRQSMELQRETIALQREAIDTYRRRIGFALRLAGGMVVFLVAWNVLHAFFG